jgi:hypothetical protein
VTPRGASGPPGTRVVRRTRPSSSTTSRQTSKALLAGGVLIVEECVSGGLEAIGDAVARLVVVGK